MKLLAPKTMKWLKLVHVTCASVWFGCAAALNLLKLCVDAQNPAQMQTLAQCMLVVDNALIFCGVLGTLITGLVYGIWTKWGFFRQLWLKWKWILSMTVVVSGTFITGPAIEGSVQPIEWYAANMSTYLDNMSTTAISGAIQFGLLLLVFYLSVMKPVRK